MTELRQSRWRTSEAKAKGIFNIKYDPVSLTSKTVTLRVFTPAHPSYIVQQQAIGAKKTPLTSFPVLKIILSFYN